MTLSRPSRTLLPVVAALAVALASGCASQPEPTSPSVTCDLLPSREVSFLSPTRQNNPFIEKSALIHGAPDEFVVLRVRLALPEPTPVSIDGSVKDGSGAQVARLQDLRQMKDYWFDPSEDVPPRDKELRSTILTRYYPSSFSFKAGKGRPEYVVVLKGNNPIPRPATVTLSVVLGDAAPREFTFSLPEKKKSWLR